MIWSPKASKTNEKNNSKSLRFQVEGLQLQQSQTLCYKKQQQTAEAAKQMAMKHMSTLLNQKWDSEGWGQGVKAELNAYNWNVGDHEPFVRKLWELCWDIRVNPNVKDEIETRPQY